MCLALALQYMLVPEDKDAASLVTNVHTRCVTPCAVVPIL